MKYLNFFPGNTRDARELSVNDHAAYGEGDIVEFVDSMLLGCTASAPLDGAKFALEDGSIWVDLCQTYGQRAVTEALEEVHALLAKLEALQ